MTSRDSGRSSRPGLDLAYDPDFADRRTADRWLANLIEEIDWQSETIRMFGRPVKVPRLVAFRGEPGVAYRYSGVVHRAAPWTECLSVIRSRVEHACQASFNSVLANLYRDGTDWMGWHSDDEPELGTEPVIASVSLGAVRRFRIRRKDRSSDPLVIDLGPGSLLIMAGDTQRLWQHSLTKTRRPVGVRVNLTFRRIQPSGVADWGATS